MRRHPSAPYGILEVEIAPAMLNTSGGVATDTGGLMLPNCSTLPESPEPSSVTTGGRKVRYLDCELPGPACKRSSSLGGHIQKRVTKAGEDRYHVIVPLGRFRQAPRIVRSVRTHAEAVALLDDLRARVIQTLVADPMSETLSLPAEVPRAPLHTSRSGVVQYWPSVVYFVRCPGGDIKIGRTKNLAGRLRNFWAISDDIELLAQEPGGERREWELHIQFMSSRVSGTERFLPSDDLLEYIAGLVESQGAPKVLE